MAFDMTKLKNAIRNKNQKTEDETIDLCNRIAQFATNVITYIESSEFEDWLQLQLDESYNYDNELYLYMGINFDYERDYLFVISDSESLHVTNSTVFDVPADRCTIDPIRIGNALNTIWKTFVDKMRSIGFHVLTAEPEWEYHSSSDGNFHGYKIKLEIIE